MTVIQTNITEAGIKLLEINEISDNLEIRLNRLEEAKTDAMIKAYTDTYDIFWANAVAICEEAGTDGHILFEKHVEMGQTIKARRPSFVELTIPANWSVEFVQDGSVIPTYTQPEE